MLLVGVGKLGRDGFRLGREFANFVVERVSAVEGEVSYIFKTSSIRRERTHNFHC